MFFVTFSQGRSAYMFQLNNLYWVSYFDEDEWHSYTGKITEETEEYIIIERDQVLQIPITNIDGLFKL